MNARERLVEQFEMSQMAKKGVYLFTMDKGLEDDLNNRIISDAVKNAFKTNGILLSKKTSITKENEDKMVIGDEEKKNIFFVRTRKEDKELNVYNNEYKIKKIELPKKVIIRTETVEEVESTKQAKIRKEGMMPPKPEEGIGKNGRKIAKRPEETRVIWIEKQAKIREEEMMPPKPEEGIGKNGRKIAKRPEKAVNDKMKYSNRIVTEIHTRVPIIYYVMMGFGLASAIFGAANLPVYRSVMLGGIGVFLVAFIGFLEIKRTERRLKITG